jgi:hypothetical protein
MGLRGGGLLTVLFLVLLQISTGQGGGGDMDGDGVPDSADTCSNTPAGSAVDESGRPIGDLDLDCDVDLGDAELFTLNFTGPLDPPNLETCDDSADNDGDDLIDCADSLDCPVGAACAATSYCSQFSTCGCPAGTGDCDANPQNGCETDTDADTSNCGACDELCSAMHGSALCQAGECAVANCDSAWCDVDEVYENGCEYNLNGNPACLTQLPYSGTVSGDQFTSPLPIVGRGEQWFRFRITENDDGIVYLSAQIMLQSAEGTDYDLYLYCQNCVGLIATSTTTGVFDTVYVRNDDDWGSADDFDIYVAVLWKSGVCGDYTLTIQGDAATNQNNCDT